MVVKPCSSSAGQRLERLVEVGDVVLPVESPPEAADELQLGDVATRCGHGHPQDVEVCVRQGPERVQSLAVLDEPSQQRAAHPLAAEPEGRPVGSVRSWLEPDVREGEARPVVADRVGPPGTRKDVQLLVEDLAALAERHSEGAVLAPTPADGGQHDEPTLGQQVERPELLGEQQRMPKRRDDRAGDDPQSLGRLRDGGHHDEAVRPGVVGWLVPRGRVVAGVLHRACRPGVGSEDDVLAEHHAIDAMPLSLDGHVYHRTEVA